MSLQFETDPSKVKQFGQDQKVGYLWKPKPLWLQLFISDKGFRPQNAVLKSTYENLEGNTLNIAMPNDSWLFSEIKTYPDKSQIRCGADYLALVYLGEALNFKPKYYMITVLGVN